MKSMSLEDANPILASEWNYNKNLGLKPNQVTQFSNKKVWWLGKCGHEWPATVANRAKNKTGCPFCSGKKALAGFNDLETEFPDIAAEWHPTKNKDLFPNNVTSQSGKKAWWLGKCGHEWPAVIQSRTIGGNGCPFCSGVKVLSGFNDLLTRYPDAALEWHPTKNGSLKASQVGSASEQKVWWLGQCGHEWCATIKDRTQKGSGCPECSRELRTSFPEQAIFYYVSRHFADAINGDKNAIGLELDIYIPSLHVAIEYDGRFYHSKNRKTDIIKNEKCKSGKITLIRIMENKEVNHDDCICLVRDNPNNKDSLTQIIKELFKYLGLKEVDVDVDRDEQRILNCYLTIDKRNSLGKLYPTLSLEWNKNKNGYLTPDKVSAQSHKKVWWKCAYGHEWTARIQNRVLGSNCPYCSGRKVLLGFNDLKTKKPALSTEWHPTKNTELLPNMVTVHSKKKVWWLGKCGHEWQATINNRTLGSGCPICGNKASGKAKYRKVKNMDTGIIYESITKAASSCGLRSGTSISSVCNGKQQTAAGYHWKYID